MSLRLRLTLLATGAVALAIVVAAVAGWFLVRSAMLAEVDSRLLARVAQADRIVGLTRGLPDGNTAERRFVMLVQDDPVGVQLLGPGGVVTHEVAVDPLRGALAEATWTPPELDAGQTRLDTVTLGGAAYRLLSTETSNGSTMRMFQPLTGLDATLGRIGWSLAAAAVGGIGLAALLGWVVSRSALRPVDRLVAATEAVSASKDLASRIDVGSGRRDEVGRLARSVNEMLIALDAARAEQRDLVENAGHELRTPLAVLRNDLGLLLRTDDGPRALDPAERRELLRELDGQVAGLADLVGELVALSRGTAEPEAPARGDVLAIVERAVAATRRVDPRVGIRVLGRPLAASVRAATLERAVANLVRNAVQVSPPGATVEVELRREGTALEIEVRDRGPGVDPDEAPHLFDRFFRGASARHRVGSGLGLAIVKQAAEMHGGAATVSDRAGGGATFTLRWPVGRATKSGLSAS